MEAEEEGRDRDSSDDGETQSESQPDDSCERDSTKAAFESNDPGLWPADLKDTERESIVRSLANRDEDQDMPNDSEAKPFPEYLKYTKAANGREKVKRDWVTYSKSNDALYCIPCVLFSKEQKRPSLSALNSQDG